ncbi:Predicted Co/Zn/Cd cation transporter, cation efflux family [Loktanella fryxellensis]|uniref:Predicted Co/Zn/Cd cation transporter, cation efflux family n=1 Tax=Loktanella fryxellensis TaxID=245187 RepID=A0A1H8A8N1_9RHOB|nr:cation transporter [Loktanella fryxellensis]SEM66149.1 Predicted Co/Zn/Cd cation transporter, cation efflux family [Loktanella fryxellensis]
MQQQTRLTEEGLLKLSIAATIAIAGFGIAVGLITRSFAITFDGIYALLDAVMSGVALIVVGLIKSHAAATMANKRLERRFSYGFWHLEPMVLGLNGILLVGVAAYGLMNAVIVLRDGGRMLSFDVALIYALVATVVCFCVAAIGARANRTIRSAFVALDVRGWVMSGGISAALVVAFGAAMAVEGTALAWILPFVDPAALAIVCLIVIPLPFPTIRQAFSDILLITPDTLRADVDRVAAAIAAAEGFTGFRTYVARIGRARQIEIYFIVPTGRPAVPLEQWDALRDRIGHQIGEEGPDRWLSIIFTTDPEWTA